MKGFKGVNKVLVIKLRHIGDVLLTVPSIRAVKEGLTDVSVAALVNSGTEDMLTLNPLVDEVITFDRSIKGRLSGEMHFIKELRKKGFDMSLDLTGGDRPALIGLLSGARYRLGYTPGNKGFMGKKLLYTHLAERPPHGTHAVLRDMGLPRAFGFDTRDLRVDLYTSLEDDATVNSLLSAHGVGPNTPFVHVHPTSRWLFKCWTDEGMARVLDDLQAGGHKVVLTTGPDNKEALKAASIIGHMKTNPVDLSGRLSLKQLASLAKLSALFFGVDTAPMHIAAAVGTPVVAIFGPSGVFDWGPWDNNAVNPWAGASPGARTPYPAKNGVQHFGRNAAIQFDWDCIPCGKDGCEGSKKSRCLDELDHVKITSVLMEVLRNILRDTKKAQGFLSGRT